MLLQLTLQWPFIRRHVCTVAPRVEQPLRAPPATAPHQTRVKTAHGHGYLERHEADGWIVHLDSGERVKCSTDHFTHMENAERTWDSRSYSGAK